MLKHQRQGSIEGAIENALDDLRHTWERLWFDRKVTGEVDMFKAPVQAQELSNGELFDKLYGKATERGEEYAPELGKDRDGEIEVDR